MNPPPEDPSWWVKDTDGAEPTKPFFDPNAGLPLYHPAVSEQYARRIPDVLRPVAEQAILNMLTEWPIPEMAAQLRAVKERAAEIVEAYDAWWAER